MSFIKTFAKKIINRLPTKKLIIFESAPDLSDNTKAVFDEMIKRGMNEKYEMLWLLKKEPTDDLPKIKNVKYVKMENTKKILLTKYISLGSIAAAAVMLITAILVADQRLVIYLSLATLLVVLMRNLPSIIRIAGRKEMKLSFEKDLSYKFDR